MPLGCRLIPTTSLGWFVRQAGRTRSSQPLFLGLHSSRKGQSGGGGSCASGKEPKNSWQRRLSPAVRASSRSSAAKPPSPTSHWHRRHGDPPPTVSPSPGARSCPGVNQGPDPQGCWCPSSNRGVQGCPGGDGEQAAASSPCTGGDADGSLAQGHLPRLRQQSRCGEAPIQTVNLIQTN